MDVFSFGIPESQGHRNVHLWDFKKPMKKKTPLVFIVSMAIREKMLTLFPKQLQASLGLLIPSPIDQVWSREQSEKGRD